MLLVSRKDAEIAKVKDVFAMVFFAVLACLARDSKNRRAVHTLQESV
jgi:hypothetical protein